MGDLTFRHAARISPEAGPDGKPLEVMPQHRYRGTASKQLNCHGRGPFCRFSVAGLPAASGIYAVTVAQQVVYVGITKNLRERWGPGGYARIYPANCFRRGQSTNCKVNHNVLVATRRGLVVSLWIHQTANPGPLEDPLVKELVPQWNNKRG